MSSNLPWSEQYRITAKAWVDADAAACLLEETKSAVLSRLMIQQGDMPVSRAEMNVKSGKEWGDFIESMTDARKNANLLKVKLEYLKMKYHEYQSANATARAEMRL